ncbi:MAG TPA: class II fumarate hydratase [Thermodesulfobacteriota bacterium]|nr:class II fumarate hydratase [Thermodesulfobacteriota bacterium]
MSTMEYRIETDSMGEMRVHVSAYHGAQTARAVENFPISGIRFPREFIAAMGMIKLAAAEVNMELGLLTKRVGKAIIRAAKEVIEGKLDDHFVVDIFQTGSGTSTNMNTNEVIANRANEMMGGKIGDKHPVHPNDHVNMGQSSNDVIPTAIHVSALESIEKNLLPALKKLQKALDKKAKEFDRIVKIGRTHLQDATPIRLGQEFSGYASMVEHGIRRVESSRNHLSELAIGGTAVGTGINTHPEFGRRMARKLTQMTGVRFKEAENHFEAQGAKDAVVETSGALKTVAVSLTKIANDIRWLGSGPRCGIGEILIPPVQPGSSIMPGKVNPVIAESVCQVAAQVIGNDAVITIGGMSGNFELNVMMPVMAHNLLQSITLLSNVVNVFTDKCIVGIKADKKRCEDMIEKSLAMCTVLAPIIGYDAAAKLAKEAYETGKTVREVALEKKIMPEAELSRVLDPWSMTMPGVTSWSAGG